LAGAQFLNWLLISLHFDVAVRFFAGRLVAAFARFIVHFLRHRRPLRVRSHSGSWSRAMCPVGRRPVILGSDPIDLRPCFPFDLSSFLFISAASVQSVAILLFTQHLITHG
jgi:hypothetical protein